jgi:hypothetical protein
VDTNTIVIIIIAVVVLVAVAFVVWFILRKRRTKELRKRFGSEYDYTLDKTGDQRLAEEELAKREKRVQALEIHRLSPEERENFLGRWRVIQTDFVDKPSAAVEKADQLIKEVMPALGFPVDDFEKRAADISVIYPNVVPNYRSAHAIANKNKLGEVGTEELRQAFVNYRSLFEELLEVEKTD